VPDRYQSLASTRVGRFAVKTLGLPNPRILRRFSPGDPLLDGPALVLGDGDLADVLRSEAVAAGADVLESAVDSASYGAVVVDASPIRSSDGLVVLHDLISPVGRSLAPCGRLVVVARPPEDAGDVASRIARRALEGFTRSLAKEIGRGSTVQLVYVAEGADDRIASTLTFLLSGRSAYVSGQVVRIGLDLGSPEPDMLADPGLPLAGRVALVTGAARGIGAAIARTLRRDGAEIVGVDVPAAASELQDLMDELEGERVSLDITAPDAAQRLVRAVADHHGGLDVVVHNAGITRDKKLVNMPRDRWTSVIDVNLRAPEVITAAMLDHGAIRPNGRVIGVASIAGIAGNAGQANYATSKAGVIGLVDAFAPVVAGRGITVNAVAPGFIETQMTAQVPLVLREAGRRLNSLAQGGLPVDVAETIAWLAHPGSYGVTGNVVRVCGQSLLGA
jgi:3-oxoacyl-[acyl-carrier protein] reductase